MPGFEPLVGLRVVATPNAIARVAAGLAAHASASGTPASLVLRFAPDDLFVGADALPSTVADALEEIDSHAIVEVDRGWSGKWFSTAAFASAVRPLVEWDVPDGSPSSPPFFAQGAIAAVPCKLLFDVDRGYLVMAPTCFVHELEERLR